jgi:hypothetical protein
MIAIVSCCDYFGQPGFSTIVCYWPLAAFKSKVIVMNKTDNGSDEDPDWINPANDRKTPYSEEEIDTFVENFILGLDDQDSVYYTHLCRRR